MFSSQVIKRCLIPAATVVVEATIKSQPKDEELICRPSELPIYSQEPIQEAISTFKEPEIPGFIEDAFKNVRLTVAKYNEELQAYKKVGFEQFDKTRENVECVVSYLQEENNTLPKAGAIGIGALTGLIFGLRGGFFKRTLYATTGALGMGALCYPRQAAEYSQIGLTEAKKYITIAYNFAYGVKKDDPPLELPSLPKIPTSLTEAWDNIKSTATSFVSDEKKPEQVSTTEKVNKLKVEDSVIKDPLDVVVESRNIALSKSCHCPIGACLGHPEENLPNQSFSPSLEDTQVPNVAPI